VTRHLKSGNGKLKTVAPLPVLIAQLLGRRLKRICR